jgi:PPM family protein phosphatase
VSGYLTIEYASLTDVGVRRSHNQDSHALLAASDADQFEQRGHLFLVADGMGAHAVGELASKIAVDNIPHIYAKHAHDGPVAALRKAILDTNTAIHTRGQQNPEFEGMGTTGTALLLRPEGVWIGHVGDSRAYRVRNGKIEQMTFDHSLVWELAKRQGVKPEDLQGIPSNVIVRSLGPEPLVQVDIEGPHPVKPGDIYVLCSDGLSGPVHDREIGAVVSALPPEAACRFLIDLANLQGGPDNITVIVVRVAAGNSEGQESANHQPQQHPKKAQRWPWGIPWPLGLLLLGIVLALTAIAIVTADLPGGFVVFAAATVVLVSGIVALILQNRFGAKREAETEDPDEPKIHRQSPCAIELPLLKRIVRAENLLEDRIRVRHWEANWDDCKKHHAEAERSMNAGDLTGAFREYCLAMIPLSEAVHRHRQKEEVFQPVWDRNSE